jgi:hypothetical protein
VLVAAGCASPRPCPPTAITPRPPEEPPPKPHLEPAKSGTRTTKEAPLFVTAIGRKPQFLGCDIRYHNAPPGSSIFLQWFVYETAQGYENEDPINKTSGKSQDVKGNGVINAYLASTEGDFAPGIFVCDFVLRHGGKEISPHERGTIWVDPPTPPK